MAEVPKNAKCENCRWYNSASYYEYGTLGHCEVNPPVVVADGSGWYHSAHPETERLSSCSQWEAYCDE
jgi:hypothetical protein